MRVTLKVLDEGAPDLGLGPALRRVGDALSEAHRLGLGLKGRHRLQFRASGDGRAAVVETAPRLACGRSGSGSFSRIACVSKCRRASGL